MKLKKIQNQLNNVEQQEGIININKPLGITSHDVISRMRRITSIRRIGHAGTLDPLATGVLIVLIGRENTRRQDEFMGFPKEYEAEVVFGRTSHTYDAEGPLTETASSEQLSVLTREQLEEALQQFVGTIQQRPPAHSAIKVGGEALYKKARRGDITDADIPTRTITIDAIDLLEFMAATSNQPPSARIRIACQKGVYIRSLAHDWGQALGVGAYLNGLVRTRIGDYTVEDAYTLESFEQHYKKII